MNIDRASFGAIFLFFLCFTVVATYFVVSFGAFEHISIGGKNYLHVADDHMITQRVAYNFFLTGQPFFNDGEAVSANTSLFWPIILSVLYYPFGFNSVLAFVILLSAAMSGLTITIASAIAPTLRLRVLSAAFILLSPVILRYGASGWEHIPQMLLTTCGLALIFYQSKPDELSIPYKALLFFAVAFAVRPDGALIVAIATLVWFFSDNRYRQVKSYVGAAILLPIPVLYLWLMHSYYGDFVPNTAHLKILPLFQRLELGVAYVLNIGQSGLVPLCLLFLGLLPGKSAFARFVFRLGVAQTLYIIYVGGDVFLDGRFYLLLFPIIATTTIVELERVFGKDRGEIAALAIAVVGLGIWHAPTTLRSLVYYKKAESTAIQQQVHVAHGINQHLMPSDGSVGMHWLGVAYHMPAYHIVDFLGKSEPVIAKSDPKTGPIGHNKWDYEYAFDSYDIAAIPMREETVTAVTAPGYSLSTSDTMFWEIGVQEILDRGNYVFVPAKAFENPEGGFGLFVRQDLIDRFDCSVKESGKISICTQ